MSAESENLRNNQVQADADGIMVKVSRQAVDGTLAEYDAMQAALKLALEYWAHRQQRYKNRHPVWVQKANAALGIATPNVTGY
jgi:hypothetical protein